MTSIRPLMYEWSKSYPAKPKDHIISHCCLSGKRFVPSYEKPCSSMPNMFCLLGWQYQRIWRCELNKLLEKREHDKVKEAVKIKPDIQFNKNRFSKKGKKKASHKSKMSDGN